VDAGCKSLISICFSKIAGAPIGSLKFLGNKEESMACALRRYGVTDSGIIYIQRLISMTGKGSVFVLDEKKRGSLDELSQVPFMFYSRRFLNDLISLFANSD
jgi:hypothetical protein